MCASLCAEPLDECRRTMASAPMASRVWAVSFRDSPFETEEPLAAKLITSAESLFAASSKEILVLVESSKNRFTTVLPRKVGSFFISRSLTSDMSSARSSNLIAWSLSRSAAERRCLMIRSPLRPRRLILKALLKCAL